MPLVQIKGAWSVGGKPVTDDDLRALAEVKAAE